MLLKRPWSSYKLLVLAMLLISANNVCFFKELPDVVNSIQVAACGVTPEEYKTAFLSPDDKLTTAQQEVIMSAHPKRQTVEDYVEK